jgi:hypothetical protein
VLALQSSVAFSSVPFTHWIERVYQLYYNSSLADNDNVIWQQTNTDQLPKDPYLLQQLDHAVLITSDDSITSMAKFVAATATAHDFDWNSASTLITVGMLIRFGKGRRQTETPKTRVVQRRLVKTRRVPRRTKLSDLENLDDSLDDAIFEELLLDLQKSKFVTEEYSDYEDYEIEYYERDECNLPRFLHLHPAFAFQRRIQQPTLWAFVYPSPQPRLQQLTGFDARQFACCHELAKQRLADLEPQFVLVEQIATAKSYRQQLPSSVFSYKELLAEQLLLLDDDMDADQRMYQKALQSQESTIVNAESDFLKMRPDSEQQTWERRDLEFLPDAVAGWGMAYDDWTNDEEDTLWQRSEEVASLEADAFFKSAAVLWNKEYAPTTRHEEHSPLKQSATRWTKTTSVKITEPIELEEIVLTSADEAVPALATKMQVTQCDAIIDSPPEEYSRYLNHQPTEKADLTGHYESFLDDFDVEEYSEQRLLDNLSSDGDGDQYDSERTVLDIFSDDSNDQLLVDSRGSLTSNKESFEDSKTSLLSTVQSTTATYKFDKSDVMLQKIGIDSGIVGNVNKELPRDDHQQAASAPKETFEHCPTPTSTVGEAPTEEEYCQNDAMAEDVDVTVEITRLLNEDSSGYDASISQPIRRPCSSLITEIGDDEVEANSSYSSSEGETVDLDVSLETPSVFVHVSFDQTNDNEGVNGSLHFSIEDSVSDSEVESLDDLDFDILRDSMTGGACGSELLFSTAVQPLEETLNECEIALLHSSATETATVLQPIQNEGDVARFDSILDNTDNIEIATHSQSMSAPVIDLFDSNCYPQFDSTLDNIDNIEIATQSMGAPAIDLFDSNRYPQSMPAIDTNDKLLRSTLKKAKAKPLIPFREETDALDDEEIRLLRDACDWDAMDLDSLNEFDAMFDS